MSSFRHLAISDSGLAFDQESGASYQLNSAGLYLLQLLRTGYDTERAAARLAERYAYSLQLAQRDVRIFCERLQRLQDNDQLSTCT